MRRGRRSITGEGQKAVGSGQWTAVHGTEAFTYERPANTFFSFRPSVTNPRVLRVILPLPIQQIEEAIADRERQLTELNARKE
jgi:hypothetical protein